MVVWWAPAYFRDQLIPASLKQQRLFYPCPNQAVFPGSADPGLIEAAPCLRAILAADFISGIS